MTTHRTSRFGLVRIAWLRFLDRVKPRPGLGSPSPRVMTATPAEAKRIKEILAKRNLPDPAKRTLRCGPWDEREDGTHVCRKCGRLDPIDFIDEAD